VRVARLTGITSQMMGQIPGSTSASGAEDREERGGEFCSIGIREKLI